MEVKRTGIYETLHIPVNIDELKDLINSHIIEFGKFLIDNEKINKDIINKAIEEFNDTGFFLFHSSLPLKTDIIEPIKDEPIKDEPIKDEIIKDEPIKGEIKKKKGGRHKKEIINIEEPVIISEIVESISIVDEIKTKGILTNLSLIELREICDKISIAKSGTKASIVKRINKYIEAKDKDIKSEKLDLTANNFKKLLIDGISYRNYIGTNWLFSIDDTNLTWAGYLEDGIINKKKSKPSLVKKLEKST